MAGADESERTELAEDRTDWAEDRTIMANERTFSSWIGAGLGCLGLAVGLQAVFGAVEPTWIAKSGATVFVLAGLCLIQIAMRNAKRTNKRLEAHAAEPASNLHLSLIANTLSVGAIAVGAILWLV